METLHLMSLISSSGNHFYFHSRGEDSNQNQTWTCDVETSRLPGEV